MEHSDGSHDGRSTARYSVRSPLLFVTLSAILFALTAVLQGRWTGLFCSWGMCVVGQFVLGVVVWRHYVQPRHDNSPWRRRTSGALAIFGLCIMLFIFVAAFWASAGTRVHYGEANLEWLTGLAFMLMAAVPAEFIILVVCLLVARERPILLLQTANLASALLPALYGMLFPIH